MYCFTNFWSDGFNQLVVQDIMVGIKILKLMLHGIGKRMEEQVHQIQMDLFINSFC